MRSYVRFKEEENLAVLNQEIQTIFKQRQNMGIEEGIREDYRKYGFQEGEQKTKTRGINKALQQGKWTLEEIAEVFEVSLDFVLQVQKGEL